MNKAFSLLLLIFAGPLFVDLMKSCDHGAVLIAGLLWILLILTAYVVKLRR